MFVTGSFLGTGSELCLVQALSWLVLQKTTEPPTGHAKVSELWCPFDIRGTFERSALFLSVLMFAA